jgi:hypothetical protein
MKEKALGLVKKQFDLIHITKDFLAAGGLFKFLRLVLLSLCYLDL